MHIAPPGIWSDVWCMRLRNLASVGSSCLAAKNDGASLVVTTTAGQILLDQWVCGRAQQGHGALLWRPQEGGN